MTVTFVDLFIRNDKKFLKQSVLEFPKLEFPHDRNQVDLIKNR